MEPWLVSLVVGLISGTLGALVTAFTSGRKFGQIEEKVKILKEGIDKFPSLLQEQAKAHTDLVAQRDESFRALLSSHAIEDTRFHSETTTRISQLEHAREAHLVAVGKIEGALEVMRTQHDGIREDVGEIKNNIRDLYDLVNLRMPIGNDEKKSTLRKRGI